MDRKYNEACQKELPRNQQRIYKQSLDAEGLRLSKASEKRFESIRQAVGFFAATENLTLADEIQGYDDQLKEVK